MNIATKLESKLTINITQSKTLNEIILILLGSVFIACASQATLPLSPIPITLQTLAIMLIGVTMDAKISGKIVLAYLCEGAVGLPVFADFSAGIHVLFGPTGGYLFGFIPAAMFTAYLCQNGFAKYRVTAWLAALLGTTLLFIPGYLVLANFIGWHNAYLFGVAPFYLIEFFKLIILATITPLFWKIKR